jgi:Zn-finger nucleic acid-binding protein/DNA-directed RNA polymerase subunit RPC12/RpoP
MTTFATQASNTSSNPYRCPSCRAAMTRTAFVSHNGLPLEIDICWPCHLIWFDGMESVALSAQSVVELFRQIHSHESDARNIVTNTPSCPVCTDKLQQTSDLNRAGRFQYKRCGNGHGRASTFMQFLREKNFVRTLAPHEIQTLSAKIKQVRCSSCGASVNIEHDTACTHCGSAIAVLDRDAVAKALAQYDEQSREMDRRRRDNTELDWPSRTQGTRTSPSSFPSSPRPSRDTWADDALTIPTTGGVVDLVVTGLGVLLSATLD